MLKAKHIPTVSVGMPVYNGEKYIREALDSLLTQTFVDFEVIISDNASTDSTEDICLEYAKIDSRIRYIRQIENQGAQWNFNYVLQASKGMYFTWFACDDVLINCFLEETVGYMSQHQECVLVSADFEFIDKFGVMLKSEKLDNIRELIKWERRLREFFRYPISNVYLCIYGLFKTEVAKAIFDGLPHPKLLRGSELPLLARLAVVGQIVSIPQVLRKYRRHDMSVYYTELSTFKSKGALITFFVRLSNVYKLRFDQIRVLIASNYTMSQKLMVVGWVHITYVRLFLKKLVKKGQKNKINEV